MEKKTTSALTKRYVLNEKIKLQATPYPGFDKALAKLQEHLSSKHKKNSAEREFILDILYRLDMLIEPSMLHQLVCDNHGLISTASVYNALLLFQEIGVVRKIQILGDSQSFFERSIGNPAHPFAICRSCGTVWSLPPLDIVQQLDELVPSRFSPLEHSLIIDGICQKCHMKQKKEAQAEEKAYQENLAAKEKKRQRAKARKLKAKSKTSGNRNKTEK